ncbi:hypothetical protein CCZ28_02780 [Pseudomonas oryzihabitans]|uniref:Uncharacterized protein n=1 Tax=Pseudomonas oryzihabitans TaxID=47885 RepID=A0A4Y5W0K0_9PSED|nr:hypothetical protein CCZ28_02780 [Pseudomonas psychrotolerans]
MGQTPEDELGQQVDTGEGFHASRGQPVVHAPIEVAIDEQRRDANAEHDAAEQGGDVTPGGGFLRQQDQ